MTDSTPADKDRRGAKRASLACLACRTRHLRCDAAKPSCKRCVEDAKNCDYAQSRRGGLDREALAALRAKKLRDGATQPLTPSGPSPAQIPTPIWLPRTGVDTPQRIQVISSPPELLEINDVDIGADPFLVPYFKCFHRYHPCALPLPHLKRYWNSPTWQTHLLPVVAVMRYIGSIYLKATNTSELKDRAETAIAEAQRNSEANGFLSQSLLFYSIALFWSREEIRSREYMDLAIDLAFNIGMHRQSFATKHGHQDPVLEEAWRRTWWQLYIVDSGYAAIKHVSLFKAKSVTSDVDLPCEEADFELGIIPTPSTLEEFESREFAPDTTVYSSFAYLIGVIRAIAETMTFIPAHIDGAPNIEAVDAVDAAVDGWLLLLPDCKRSVMSSGGAIDELMFYANMSINAALVGFHRPFSEIMFDPLESLSSCASRAHTSNLPNDLKSIHTTRCLASIQSQIKLLTLPKRPFCHSPFVSCMVVTGMLPYLSACRCLLTGKELAVARQQIRLGIGCLRALGSIWTRGAKTVEEIQAIAREILGLGAKGSATSRRVSNLVGVDNETISESGNSGQLLPDVDYGLSPSWMLVNQQLELDTWFTSYYPAE